MEACYRSLLAWITVLNANGSSQSIATCGFQAKSIVAADTFYDV